MRKWFGVCVCILAFGCINTNVQRLDQAPRPARSPDSVTVLSENPQQPYTVIAFIEATAETIFDTFDDLRDEMVGVAGRLGADAVILGPETTDSKFIFTGIAMIKSDRRRMTGKAIVYKRRG